MKQAPTPSCPLWLNNLPSSRKVIKHWNPRQDNQASNSGVPQVLLTNSLGAISVAPGDGKLLWKHAWSSGTRIMQPAVMPEGDVLISSGDAENGVGMWIALGRWVT